jgi:hypothetical protein
VNLPKPGPTFDDSIHFTSHAIEDATIELAFARPRRLTANPDRRMSVSGKLGVIPRKHGPK